VIGGLQLGVSRSHGVVDLEGGARRFADALGVLARCRVGITVTRDYERLLEGVRVGAIGVAWMPPLVHARAAAAGAPLAAVSVRAGALTYRSALLVRAGSALERISDLEGARVAWADPFSASGYLFPRLHLLAAGIDPRYQLAKESFCGSAAQACRAVAAGAADLCAHYVSDRAGDDPEQVQRELRQALGESVADELRLLAITERIPPDGLVLAPPLDGLRQATVRDALLRMHQHYEGRTALRLLLSAERLAPVTGPVVKLISRASTVLAMQA
jgi:phosphonate transport system substrate-binding protein